MPVMGTREGNGEMPHERIYGQKRGDEAFDLSLQWEKAQEWRSLDDDLGDGVVSLSIVSSTHPEQDVLAYAYVDRTGCNRLIEKLRRARDQAFGRDE